MTAACRRAAGNVLLQNLQKRNQRRWAKMRVRLGSGRNAKRAHGMIRAEVVAIGAGITDRDC
jgi:hypothetical protein